MTESTVLRRHPANPILAAKDIPYRADLVFNAGVCKYQGQYVMVFRNDYGSNAADWDDYNSGRRSDMPRFQTSLGLAFSADGVKWRVEPQPCLQMQDDEIIRCYDPRLTVIEGRMNLSIDLDTNHVENSVDRPGDAL